MSKNFVSTKVSNGHTLCLLVTKVKDKSLQITITVQFSVKFCTNILKINAGKMYTFGQVYPVSSQYQSVQK